MSFLSSVSRTAAPTGDRRKSLALLPRRQTGGERVEGGGRCKCGREREEGRAEEREGQGGEQEKALRAEGGTRVCQQRGEFSGNTCGSSFNLDAFLEWNTTSHNVVCQIVRPWKETLRVVHMENTPVIKSLFHLHLPSLSPSPSLPLPSFTPPLLPLSPSFVPQILLFCVLQC